VVDTVQSYLAAINEISRQLLSQLDTQLENNNENTQQTLVTNEESKLADKELKDTAAERQSIIAKLFEVYTQEQLGAELPLVNEMASLDQQLTAKAQLNKQAIAEQMLKLRNSKKVTKLYQKY
jgi:hypothetical protein